MGPCKLPGEQELKYDWLPCLFAFGHANASRLWLCARDVFTARASHFIKLFAMFT